LTVLAGSLNAGFLELAGRLSSLEEGVAVQEASIADLQDQVDSISVSNGGASIADVVSYV